MSNGNKYKIYFYNLLTGELTCIYLIGVSVYAVLNKLDKKYLLTQIIDVYLIKRTNDRRFKNQIEIKQIF